VHPRRRVAVTLEQCWHRVPGGTATSILGTVAALTRREDVEIVGVAARHSEPAPAPFRPAVAVEHLPLPRLAMYEAWHGLRWPRVERATGPVDVVHATAVAVPPTQAPLVMTIHDLAFLADPSLVTRHGNRFFRRGTELAKRHARLVLVPSEATAAECRAAGFDPDRLRIVPWGVDAEPVQEGAVDDVRERHGLLRPYVLFVGTIEPRKNLGGVVDAVAGLAGREIDLVIVGPAGWNEDLDARFDLEPGFLATLKELNLLYDRDANGEFLHFYTATVGSVFFEMVERRGSYDGYGAPNAPVRHAVQYDHLHRS
jgi:glycosyltransferase involved in cell wall biosynthesis